MFAVVVDRSRITRGPGWGAMWGGGVVVVGGEEVGADVRCGAGGRRGVCIKIAHKEGMCIWGDMGTCFIEDGKGVSSSGF